MSGLSSIGPLRANAARSVGARLLAIHCRRAMTSAPFAPKRSTLPRPSFMLLHARLPAARFSTTKSGIEGLMIPAIGPTAE